MTWAKKHADGQVSWGDRITGPGFTLDSAADPPADGWEWFDTLADMALELGVEIRATDAVWVAPPGPLSDDEHTRAVASGATQILHGIPPALVDVIPPGTLGFFDIPEPPPPTTPVDDGLSAEQVLLREAEQARRAAYDAVMASGTISMARLRDADRAGSDAFYAYLEQSA